MRCPTCGSTDVAVEQYDFGTCQQTGYHDAGERYRCCTCGNAGDSDELIEDEEDE